MAGRGRSALSPHHGSVTDLAYGERVTLGMIWAQARGAVIGEAGDMPWRLPEDMARFKAVTMGHPVVMGRLNGDELTFMANGQTFKAKVGGNVMMGTLTSPNGDTPFTATRK